MAGARNSDPPGHENDFHEDEVTGRTALAQEALHGVHAVQMENLGLKRRVRRLSWVWTTLALVFGIFAAGFIAREYADHYATREHVAGIDTRVELLEKRDAAREEHDRAQAETIKRMAGQLDRLYDRLIGR